MIDQPDDFTIDQMATIWAAVERSRRAGKQACYELVGDSSSATLDAAIGVIQNHPDFPGIVARAARLNTDLVAMKTVVDPPHDRWIMGTGPTGRVYLIHTHTPRFTGELFGDGDELPGGGVVVGLRDGSSLANIAWIDRPPSHAVVMELADLAADAVDELDAIDDAIIDARE